MGCWEQMRGGHQLFPCGCRLLITQGLLKQYTLLAHNHKPNSLAATLFAFVTLDLTLSNPFEHHTSQQSTTVDQRTTSKWKEIIHIWNKWHCCNRRLGRTRKHCRFLGDQLDMRLCRWPKMDFLRHVSSGRCDQPHHPHNHQHPHDQHHHCQHQDGYKGSSLHCGGQINAEWLYRGQHLTA